MSLKLSSDQFQTVLLMGGGCATAGILYQLLNIFLEQSTEVDVPLKPDTEVLPEQGMLYHFYRQLAQFRDYHESSFTRAMQASDRMFLIAKQVKLKPEEASNDDLVEAFTEFHMVNSHLSKIRDAAVKKGSGRDAARIQNLCVKMYPLLQQATVDIQKVLRN